MLKFVVLFATAIVAAVVAEDTEINAEEFVSQLNNAQTLWQASQNEVTDKGYSYMKRLLGAKLPKEGENMNLPVVNKVSKNIPESFDAREVWSHCPSIASIKNQGHCGSCWAVAAAGAASDRVCIHSDTHTKVNISAENLLSCCSDCVDPGTAGCDGGYPEKAWDYFHHSGLVTGGDYGTKDGCQPYLIQPSGDKNSNEYTPPCSKKCTNKKYGRSFNRDKHYGKTSYQVAEKEAAIQTDILNNGPVEAAFMVYYDFMFYSSGIYIKSSSMKMGGHAVRLIGWGVENGVKYWLVANSWGRSWGENGTFRIRRGTNECEFESYVTAGLIRK